MVERAIGIAVTPTGAAPVHAIRPTSRAPERTASITSGAVPCRTRRPTLGYSLRNRARITGRSTTVGNAGALPIESVPRSRRSVSTTTSRASRSATRARRAAGRSARPAGVRVRRFGPRTKRAPPSSRSRVRIAIERPDCTMFTRRAARVKECSSATATNCSSCRTSMAHISRRDDNYQNHLFVCCVRQALTCPLRHPDAPEISAHSAKVPVLGEDLGG